MSGYFPERGLNGKMPAGGPEALERGLNADASGDRLAALGRLLELERSGAISAPAASGFVNNHIHTVYSFSPYSPSKAVWRSRAAGLSVSGIVDHDSVAGVREYREAGLLLGFPTTAGFELRSDHTATPLGGRRTNNPDQEGVSYMTFHGLRDSALEAVGEFLKPVAEARGERNRAMCAKLAEISGLPLDYESDVLPLSRRHEGGSVTERHLLCALSLAAIHEYGGHVFEFLKRRLSFGDGSIEKLTASWGESVYNLENNKAGVAGDGRMAADGAQMGDAGFGGACPYGGDFFLYDLIGAMKASLVGSFYIPAGAAECPPLKTLVKFASAHDIIITYPYLGDVTNSVTGDKKAQSFEDGFLDELFGVLDGMGIRAVSYMPARNTREQAVRVRELADRYGMLQISGEDINSPRQPFISEASKDPYFANLRETTWKLVEHERGEINLLE
ncbi:MAG: PHP domain-containing protein [Clostridiales Family XIII bacterium]|jgi:hypothetical protein|nr:PHP domain-containing protein [Clostridiales Family XIII bacterium]